MPVSDRRAPVKETTFTVLAPFRYMRRSYQEGDLFTPRFDVPRHRIDTLWRNGYIGSLDGSQCTAIRNVNEPMPDEMVRALDALAKAHEER